MVDRSLLQIFAFACLCLSLVAPYCFMDTLRHKYVDDKLVAYCHMSDDTELSFGQKIRTKNCLECSCGKYGLSCCGIGHAAGVMVYVGCEMEKLDNCCYHFIDSDTGHNCTKVFCPRESDD